MVSSGLYSLMIYEGKTFLGRIEFSGVSNSITRDNINRGTSLKNAAPVIVDTVSLSRSHTYFIKD